MTAPTPQPSEQDINDELNRVMSHVIKRACMWYADNNDKGGISMANTLPTLIQQAQTTLLEGLLEQKAIYTVIERVDVPSDGLTFKDTSHQAVPTEVIEAKLSELKGLGK